MARYYVISHFPTGDAVAQTFKRRDAAYRAAWNAVRDQYEAQALLDRPCAWTAVRAIPADLPAHCPLHDINGNRVGFAQEEHPGEGLCWRHDRPLKECPDNCWR